MLVPGVAVHVCSLSAGETETGESLDSLDGQLTELVSSSLRERERGPVSQNTVESKLRDTLG